MSIISEYGPVDFIDDGFGNSWLKCHPKCGLEIVRPGKVQCWCEDKEYLIRLHEEELERIVAQEVEDGVFRGRTASKSV